MIGLRNKIAQMLIMGFSGYDVHENSEVVKWLQTDGLGGVLLFDFDLPANMHGKNLRDKAQIKRLNQDLNDYSALFGNALPLLIAVDYEGGVVDRLSKVEGCIKTMKPCEQAQLPDEGLYNEAGRMAGTLKDLGFNLNFAPVVDLNLNDQQGIIGKLGRCFSTLSWSAMLRSNLSKPLMSKGLPVLINTFLVMVVQPVIHMRGLWMSLIHIKIAN